MNLQPASGGESGIRTHGTLPYDGFQDRSVITTSVSLRIGLVYIIIKEMYCQELFSMFFNFSVHKITLDLVYFFSIKCYN